MEANDFQGKLSEFEKFNTVILGISKDTIASHKKFAEKYGLTFHLLSDKDKVACNLFEVIKPKTLYGKLFDGIERSTFIINKNGEIVKEYRKLKVDGHVTEVLEEIKILEN